VVAGDEEVELDVTAGVANEFPAGGSCSAAGMIWRMLASDQSRMTLPPCTGKWNPYLDVDLTPVDDEDRLRLRGRSWPTITPD
jgi:hypothetical protein